MGVPTRKRSMRRWSGRRERSWRWAMRRSAESRVRESREGGRIGARSGSRAPSFIIPTLPLQAKRAPRCARCLDPPPPRFRSPSSACRQSRRKRIGDFFFFSSLVLFGPPNSYGIFPPSSTSCNRTSAWSWAAWAWSPTDSPQTAQRDGLMDGA